MASLLFPPLNQKVSVKPRWTYASVLGDIIRGSSDAIDALTLFHDLLLSKSDGPSSIGFMGFDAHGGDTGCQLRAGMLQEVFTTHRQLMFDPRTKSSRSPLWINSYLDRLSKLNEAAKHACAQLTQKRVMPSKFGFHDHKDSAQGILLALGWDETISDELYGEPTNYFPATGSSTDVPSVQFAVDAQEGDWITSDAPIHVSPAESVTAQHFNYPLKTARTLFNKLIKMMFDFRVTAEPAEVMSIEESEQPVALSPISDASSTDGSNSSASGSPDGGSLSPSSSSISEFEQDDVASPLCTRWNIRQPATLVRFLVFSYTLSKYKQFCRLSHVVGARVCPELAVAAAAKMIEPYTAPKNTDYKPLKMPRYRAEFATYQAWLSDFSCAWIRSLGLRSAMQPRLEK